MFDESSVDESAKEPTHNNQPLMRGISFWEIYFTGGEGPGMPDTLSENMS